MLENQLVPITRSNLAFQNTEISGETGIHYNVTHPLKSKDGSLEHIERPSEHIEYFTQEDVDNNRIVYRPPNDELGDKEKEVFFYFTGRFIHYEL